jgi:hypothetical protein
MKGHSGAKPHVCHHCTKSFREASSLRAHIMIHTGEKPFTSDQCPNAYLSLGQLQKHTATMHTE